VRQLVDDRKDSFSKVPLLVQSIGSIKERSLIGVIGVRGSGSSSKSELTSEELEPKLDSDDGLVSGEEDDPCGQVEAHEVGDENGLAAREGVGASTLTR